MNADDITPEEARARRRSRLFVWLGAAPIAVGIVLFVADLLGMGVSGWLYAGLWTSGLLCFAASAVQDDKVRRYDVQRDGEALGLTYASSDGRALSELPRSLIPAPPGRTADDVGNVLRGTWKGMEVLVFDASATEEHSKWDDEPSTFKYRCAAARADVDLPRMLIEPRRGLGRRRRWLGDQGGSHLPSPEFRERFVVECEDPQFILAFLSGGVEHWLLEHGRFWGIRMDHEWVLLYRSRHSVKGPEALLSDLKNLHDRLPSSHTYA